MAVFFAGKKCGLISEAADSKEAVEGSQERRCKGPLRVPERLEDVESVGEVIASVASFLAFVNALARPKQEDASSPLPKTP